MDEKLILTNNEIEKDIRNALKNPPYESEKSYRRKPFIIIAAFILLVILAIIWPVVVLSTIFVFLIGLPIWPWLWRYYLENKKIVLNDYQITQETVNCVIVETYVDKRSKHKHTRHIYCVRFENGKIWAIPTNNYAWTEKHRMSFGEVYQNTHMEDTMIVVTKKRSGKIVMAYNTDIFTYVN